MTKCIFTVRTNTSFDKSVSTQGALTCFWSFPPYHMVLNRRWSLLIHHRLHMFELSNIVSIFKASCPCWLEGWAWQFIIVLGSSCWQNNLQSWQLLWGPRPSWVSEGHGLSMQQLLGGNLNTIKTVNEGDSCMYHAPLIFQLMSCLHDAYSVCVSSNYHKLPNSSK